MIWLDIEIYEKKSIHERIIIECNNSLDFMMIEWDTFMSFLILYGMKYKSLSWFD